MYLKHYKLSENPFRLSPDPRFLHMSRSHAAALRALWIGIAQRKGLQVLTGPVGTGKTLVLNTLLTLLSTRSATSLFPTALIVNPRLSSQELLEALLQEFSINAASASKTQQLNQLQQLFFAAQRNGRTSLIFVDEAHLLSSDVAEELRLLMNVDSHRSKIVQVILSGQSELIDRLRDKQMQALRQRIAVAAKLDLMNGTETAAYVRHRLRVAGCSEGSLFSPEALKKVHEISGGAPRLVNTLCDTCLTIGFEMRAASIGAEIVDQAASRHELALMGNSKPD